MDNANDSRSSAMLKGTHSMQQSPSQETDRSSVNQEIPCILWKLKVHYPIHQSTQQSLSRARSIQSKHYLLNIHLNNILPSRQGLPSGLYQPGSLHQNTIRTSPFSHVTCPTHYILVGFIT